MPAARFRAKYKCTEGERLAQPPCCGMVPFAQTTRQDAIDFQPEIESQVGRMTVSNDKFKDYVRYAEHCLNMAAAPTDQESRSIQREMAAEWLRLADVVRRPRKSKQMQMG